VVTVWGHTAGRPYRLPAHALTHAAASHLAKTGVATASVRTIIDNKTIFLIGFLPSFSKVRLPAGPETVHSSYNRLPGPFPPRRAPDKKFLLFSSSRTSKIGPKNCSRTQTLVSRWSEASVVNREGVFARAR